MNPIAAGFIARLLSLLIGYSRRQLLAAPLARPAASTCSCSLLEFQFGELERWPQSQTLTSRTDLQYFKRTSVPECCPSLAPFSELERISWLVFLPLCSRRRRAERCMCYVLSQAVLAQRGTLKYSYYYPTLINLCYYSICIQYMMCAALSLVLAQQHCLTSFVIRVILVWVQSTTHCGVHVHLWIARFLCTYS